MGQLIKVRLVKTLCFRVQTTEKKEAHLSTYSKTTLNRLKEVRDLFHLIC